MVNFWQTVGDFHLDKSTNILDLHFGWFIFKMLESTITLELEDQGCSDLYFVFTIVLYIQHLYFRIW